MLASHVYLPQGGGKSHTLGCVLEACLVPCPEESIVRLNRPMSAVVLHFDPSPASICEVTGIISPSPRLYGAAPSRCLPRDRMVVLVSPTFYHQRRAFYGDYCEVRPLLFSWASLTADHLRRIMRVDEGDNQLYVASMLNVLRGFQRGGSLPGFEIFLETVNRVCNVKTQNAPLMQRLELLQSLVRESRVNAPLAHVATDLADACSAGGCVIVDLTDPLLSSAEANGIFQVASACCRNVRVSHVREATPPSPPPSLYTGNR